MSEESQQRIFVGESREWLVRGLLKLYDDCSKEPRKPVWVSLEAPSGWGKTRVGLELYERLAARQPENGEPAYWPDRIVNTMLERKVTRPRDFVRPAHSLPQFLWLGITCSHRDRLVSQAWRQDIQQLECHLLFLEVAYRANTDVKERWGKALLAKREEIAQLTIAEMVQQAAGALEWAFPGMGLAKEAAASVGKTIQERMKEWKEVSNETRLTDPDKSSEVEQVVTYLKRISEKALPVVLLVEDVHLADTMLYDFIDDLMQRGHSVLIMSTTWPERATVEASPRLIELFDKYSDRLYRVTESAPPPFDKRAGLIELERDAREEILRSKFKNVDEDTAKSLLDHYVSPLALEAFCQIDYWHDCFPDGDLRLDSDQIKELPYDLVEIYFKLWEQMSLTEKATLVVGWFLSPENINADAAPGERYWTDPVLRDVMLSLTLSDAVHEEIAGTLNAQTEPGAWIRAIGEYLRAFIEPLHSQIVEEQGARWLKQKLGGNDREKVLKALVSRLVDGSDQVRIGNTSRAILALCRASYLDNNHQLVAEAIDALLEDLAGNAIEFTERDRLWKLFLELDREQVSDDTRFAICRKQAAKLVEEDMPFLAVELYASLLEEMMESESFGRFNRETLDVRHDMAVCQCDMGRYKEGRLALRAAVRDMRTVRDANDPVTLRAEMSLGWYHGDERYYTDALNRLIRISEPNSLPVLVAKRGLISLFWDLGKYDAAIENCDRLLIDMSDVFHSSSHNMFEMKKMKATLLELNDQTAESIKYSESILEEMKASRDAEHPTVLDARCDLIYKLERAENPSNTLAMAEELVADAMRILGADHPIYRRAEQKRIDALMSLERFDDAIPASEKLLAQVLNSPGAEDRAGSYARNWHMFNLWGGGRYEEAIAAHADALEVEVEQLGADHRRIFAMKSELVELLYDAGDIEKALAESTRLVNEAREKLDPDDEIIEAAVERKTRIESSLPQ